MDRPTFSQDWHRVGLLQPRLRNGVAVHRRYFRGRRSYVVHDPASNQYFRLDPVSYHLIGLLDGHRTVDQAWQLVTERFADHAPTQGEAVGLLGQMYAGNLLAMDTDASRKDSASASPAAGVRSAEQLFERLKKRNATQRREQMASLFYWRWPLLDPTPVLDFLLPVCGWLIKPWAMIAWVFLVMIGAMQLLVHWQDFRANGTQVLRADTLIPLALLCLVAKIAHELAHGLVCRKNGGAVHDMGIRMLIFTPVPYCDVTSSWAFASRWQRAAVGMAGIIVDTTFASLAAILWACSSAGYTHDLAQGVVLLVGFGTLLFNANPLMRYDGYYVLGDLLDIPNLFQRANAQITYLVQHYLFGLVQVRPVTVSRREMAWLIFYSIASWAYRLVIFPAILIMLWNRLFGIGAVLALAAMVSWGIVPLLKLVHYLCTDLSLHGHRLRATGAVFTLIALVAGVIGWLPLPQQMHCDGVLESPTNDQVQLVMATDGFVDRVLVNDGQNIAENEPIFVAVNPELQSRKQTLEAQLIELQVQLAKAADHDPALQVAVAARIASMEKQLANAKQDLQNLSLPAPMQGLLVAPEMEGLSGRFVHRGDVIGLIRHSQILRVSAVIDQTQNAALFEAGNVRDVQVRVRGQSQRVLHAKVQSVLPATQMKLPHASLGTAGGGSVRTAIDDPTGLKTQDGFYIVWLELDADQNASVMEASQLQAGQLAKVRFTLASRPLALQWWRKLLQMLGESWTV